MIARRTFIKGAAAAGLAAAAGGLRVSDGHAQQVPHSSGTEPAKLKAPPGACDCHHHIYDARFPFSRPEARMIADARISEYRLLQRRIGTSRSIVVTPSPFPAAIADNEVTLDAIAQSGGNALGVAIVNPAVTDAELKTLNARGIRGIRFSLASSNPSADPAAASFDVIELLATRVHALGWHVQFNMTAEQIVAAEAVLQRLPTMIVFDHMGHMPQPAGTAHPAFGVVRKLIDKGRTWVKLSVTNNTSKDGPPGYADANRVAQAYVQAAPERLLWGSNWPHPSQKSKPDDALLFDLMARWAPDEATRNRILVQNPAALYGFLLPA